MTRFVLGEVTLEFDCDPVRPAPTRRELRQVREVDSDSNPVVYGKGDPVKIHRLAFPRISTATLTALLDFVARECAGVRYSFTWIDHAGVEHVGARLTTSGVRHLPVGPERHRVEIEIEVPA